MQHHHASSLLSEIKQGMITFNATAMDGVAGVQQVKPGSRHRANVANAAGSWLLSLQIDSKMVVQVTVPSLVCQRGIGNNAK